MSEPHIRNEILALLDSLGVDWQVDEGVVYVQTAEGKWDFTLPITEGEKVFEVEDEIVEARRKKGK